MASVSIAVVDIIQTPVLSTTTTTASPTTTTAATVTARGIATLHLSMSHDAGLATAYVVAEAADGSTP